MKQRPVAIGLLLCKQVIVEESTRNLTPVNCFTRRKVEQTPTDALSFVVFANLTDGVEEIELTVLIQRLDTYEEVYQYSITYRFTDPLRDMGFLLRVRDCYFPVFGDYQVALLADGELIAHRKLRIVQKRSST